MHTGQDPRHVLIVRMSHLGDVVHALPVYHALCRRFPRARLGWVVQPEFAELVRGLPGGPQVFEFGRREGLRAWARLRRELRLFAPDLTVDCQGNLKSALATWLSRAPRRAGLDALDWREPLGARALTESAPPVRNGAPAHAGPHAVERMLALARHLAGAAAEPARFDAGLDPRERARGRELLERYLPGGRGVVLQLGDARDLRSWPLARHAELARALERAREPHVVLSGPGEQAEGRALERELGSGPLRRHWVGQRGLRELAAFFAAAAEGGATFVGADSGPMHMAWAAGLPVVSLAGPQSHRRTGPWAPPERAGSPHRVVRSARELACAPCLARRCSHAEGPVCMASIDAASVVRAVLARPSGGPLEPAPASAVAAP